VVVNEVRSLASRSSGAAREIKSLIEASVDTVESGHVLVTQAGQSMNDILAQVQRVTELILEITTATEHQTRAIDQVSGSIEFIDQATQQNAALVEESSAATQSLRDQASQLSQAIAAFRLHEGGEPMRPLAPAMNLARASHGERAAAPGSGSRQATRLQAAGRQEPAQQGVKALGRRPLIGQP
jgi:chromosome segregation ATPase